MMSKMMSKLVFACLLAGCITLTPAFAGSAGAGETKGKASNEAMDKAQKTRGGGPDENIKSKSMSNNPNAATPAPPDKGGEKTRGYCRLHVDNQTPWIIWIYVDGYYVGAASTWGDAYGTYSEGAHKFYAVAEFDDGSRLTFGPRDVGFCGGPYTWTLTR